MTPKQRDFAKLYATNGKVAEAARGAGYCEQYSTKLAFKLLKKPDVIAEVKRIREKLNQTADKSATDVVNEFSKIAFTDRVGFLKEDPYYPGEFVYKSPDELSDNQRAIVEKVTYTMHEIVIIRDGNPEKLWIKHYSYMLAEKSKALENMGRHFGIFDDKLKLIGNQQNPFKNASPAQLEKLKQSWVETMNQGAIEGTYKEVGNGKG
jgi:phage terminase small subunit